MRSLLVSSIAFMLLAACHSYDVAQDRENVYLAEGHYNLGQFEKAITHASLVKKNSALYDTAQKWLRYSQAAKEDAEKGGYEHTRIGRPKHGSPSWEIEIP